jgi:hypothetical protein
MKKKDKLTIVREHYPNAVTTTDCVNSLFNILETYYDLEPNQIMLADSICSDDVNTIEYPASAYEMLGPFKMGGLDGFPFTGLTGMGAFAHHVPENGAVLIYYGPHIGVSKSGATGEIMRIGQKQPSGCCGAAKAALGKLVKSEIIADDVTDLDYQMNTIEQIFLKNKTRILAASNPLMEATEAMYEAIDDRIRLLAEKTDYPCRYLILMGTVHINGDHDMGSFTSLRRFEIIDLETKEIHERKDELIMV